VEARERHGIQHVEGLGAQMKIRPAPYLDHLRDSEIDPAEGRPNEYVPAAVAELPRCHERGIQERARIEPMHRRSLIRRKAGIPDQRGAGGGETDSRRVDGCDDGKWSPALIDENTRQVPPSQNAGRRSRALTEER